MQRLTGDVQGPRYFFSNTLVSLGKSLVSLVGGTVMLLYLDWRLEAAGMHQELMESSAYYRELLRSQNLEVEASGV